MKKVFLLGAAAVAFGSTAMAGTATVDGTKDAVYGNALSVQTVQTNFGDANGNLTGGSGGELDGLYATADSTNLYVLLTGNLEANGNGTFLLIDSSAQSTGTSVLPNITGSLDDLWASADSIGGTTMPVSFAPEFGLYWKCFGSPVDYAVTIANFPAATSTAPANQSTGATVNPAIGSPVTIGGASYQFALNNSNTAGVAGGTAASTASLAAAVTTGWEARIPLSVLGITPGSGASVKLLALYTSGSFGGNTFASNQKLPPLTTPQGNIGGLENNASKLLVADGGFATYTLPAAAVNEWSMY